MTLILKTPVSHDIDDDDEDGCDKELFSLALQPQFGPLPTSMKLSV
jgi:hypothetical protein